MKRIQKFQIRRHWLEIISVFLVSGVVSFVVTRSTGPGTGTVPMASPFLLTCAVFVVYLQQKKKGESRVSVRILYRDFFISFSFFFYTKKHPLLQMTVVTMVSSLMVSSLDKDFFPPQKFFEKTGGNT